MASQETLRDDVRVGDIFLEEEYGRPLKGPKVNALTAKWDRDRVGVVYLSLRGNGKFACLDGWHRITACRAAEGDEATLPARVYFDLTIAEEAGLFNAFNRDRTKLSAAEIFRSRLVEGEHQAHAIYDIVRAIGLDISFDGRDGEGLIQGVATLDHIYERYGGDMLRETYLTMSGTMGNESSALSADVAKGLAAFLLRYGDRADRNLLHDILATNTARRIKMHASGIKVEAPGLNASTACGMALLRLYNDRVKRGTRLAPWQTIVHGNGREKEAA
jgi:hypothetical protein